MSWLSFDLGELWEDIWDDQAEWSQETFGTDIERGPIGPLKHLVKEAKEAQDSPRDITEYADCLLLIMDSARRAGFNKKELLLAARAKLRVCEAREYPRPEPGNNEPTEHLRE